LNKALFDTVSAGIDASRAVETVGVAAQLAVAGLTDVSTATDGLTSALNAYALGADEAQSVSAKFFTAQKLGKTTISELSNSFGLVGANAQAAGVSLEELLGSVSAVTLGGVATSSAFTGLKAAIANISKPSADAAKEAKRLGIEFDANTLRAKGLKGFLDQLTQAQNFNKNSVTKLFRSTEAQSVIFALTGNQAGSFADAVKKLGNEQEIASTFTKAHNEQIASFENQSKILSNNISALAIQLGEHFAPALLKVNEELVSFIQFISENEDMVAFAAGAAAITAAISATAVAMSTLTIAAISMNAALAASGSTLTVTTILMRTLVGATGIGLVIVGLGLLYENWDKTTRFMKASWESTVRFVTDSGAVLSNFFTKIFSGDFEGAVNELDKFKNVFTDSMDTFRKEMSTNSEVPLVVVPRDEDGNKFLVDKIFDDFRAEALGEPPVVVPFVRGKEEGGIGQAEAEAAKQNELDAQDAHNQKLSEQQIAQNEKMAELKAENEERKTAFREELNELGIEERDLGDEKEIEALRNKTAIKNEMNEEFNRKQVSDNRAKNKKLFEDEKKNGAVISKLNQLRDSQELQSASVAASELVKLQNSKSKKQREIAKGAARTLAVIDTAKGAIAVYSSFASTIPGPIGVGLGIAGAAAITAYGIERQNEISAANSGGFVPNLNGGSSFGDSQLTATTPNEFIVPANSASQIIDDAAAAQVERESLEDGGGGSGAMEVLIGFADNAFDIIEEKLLERRALNTGIL
ncbi:phage tail tape measure protein, partial [Candidatus Babeliales bacterium]|nr:phage tail tape measure protein [Candidatus Babeliales bacterium]